MRIAILYNQCSIQSSVADLDVLRQVLAVEDAIRELGDTSVRCACSLNLDAVRNELNQTRPEIVFNLVESVGGTDRLMPLATLLLESAGLHFTGASSLVLLTTCDKLAAKKKMQACGLPTPTWMASDDDSWSTVHADQSQPDRAIIKATAEHASLGLTNDSVIRVTGTTATDIRRAIAERSQAMQTAHFAEAFIEGREFNLSLLASDAGPEVLPIAEIDFVDFAADAPHIVGHAAKWLDNTHEFHNTPRRFDFPASDQPLLDELAALARQCWFTFGLHGWARVDFRVDTQGQPWILEINANPCLSPDAGFAAACDRAELTFSEVVRRILNDVN